MFSLREESLHVLFSALYARGAPRSWSPPPRRWPGIERFLRREMPTLGESPTALRAAGYAEEGLLLTDAALLRWAERHADELLTPFCPAYPMRWISRLGASAPPAVWIRVGNLGATALSQARQGSAQAVARSLGAWQRPQPGWALGAKDIAEVINGPLIGVVGSRHVPQDVEGFAREVGAEIPHLWSHRALPEAQGRNRSRAHLDSHPSGPPSFGVSAPDALGGCSLVSGGAIGCDSFAAEGTLSAGGHVLRILPRGLRQCPPSANEGTLDISVAAPDEPFSTALAMERNQLIYASAMLTVVVHARLREGGTWHGAVGALRRQMGRICVRGDSASLAHRSLEGLGAERLDSPSSLGTLLAHPTPSRSLFGDDLSFGMAALSG